MRLSRNVTQLLQTVVHVRMSCTSRVPFLRRHERQMEQRYGPAWRYVAPTVVPARGDLERNAEKEAPVMAGSSRQVIEEYVMGTASCSTSGTVPPAPLYRSKDDLRVKALEVGLLSDQDDVRFSVATNERVSPSQDPLLEFLEKNQEDGAFLLAMWTSLRRSCLHASEISESLSFGARWCLHRLIHMRAIAAAVRFYHRLLELGVQLQKWDVVVLLSNLPYERSTTVMGSQEDVWMREGSTSSLRKTRGGVHERAQAERGSENNSTLQRTDISTACSFSEKSKECCVSELDTSPSTVVSNDRMLLQPLNTVKYNMDACVSSTNLPPTHSDWIRRWVLYEASMGNIDVLDDEGFPTTPSMDPFSSCAHDDVGIDENTLHASQEAGRIVAVTALLKHLLLLHDTRNILETERRMEGKQLSSTIKVRRTPPSARQRRHWVEALCLASIYLESRSSSQRGSLLPCGFLCAVRGAVTRSGSWMVSFRYLQSAERNDMTFSKNECVKFMLMAAEAKPWRGSSHVERFVAHRVMPFFSAETAADYAVKSLWLLHVCSLKPDRPGDYMELMGKRAENLPAAIKHSMACIKLAVSHLRIEVDRYHAEVVTEKMRAASVRLGLFSQDVDMGTQTEKNADGTVAVIGNGTGGTLNSAALLSEEIRDSFMLVCIGIPSVVSVAPIVSTSQDDELQLSTLLVDTVYGRTGLWGIFSDVYIKRGDISFSRTPERTLMAVTMALSVVRTSLALCETHKYLSSHRQGASLLIEKQLTLLLGIVAETLSSVSAHDFAMVEVRQRVGDLLREVSRLTKSVIRFMNLFPKSEKLLFGCIPVNVVEAVTLVVRILLLLMWKTNSPAQCLPNCTQILLRLLLQPTSTFGKQVRSHLRQKEVEQLNYFFYRRDRRGNDRSRCSMNDLSSISLSPQLRMHTPEDILRIEKTASLHKDVYLTALRHEGNPTELENVLTSRLRHMQWDDALLLLQVSLHHLRLTPGTFSVTFFAEVLERLRHGGWTGAERGALLWSKAVTVYWDAVEHTAARSLCSTTVATATGKGPQQHEREVLSALLLPLVRLSVVLRRHNLGFAWLAQWSTMHPPRERDVQWKMKNIRARSELWDKKALQMCVNLYHNLHRSKQEPMSLASPSIESLLCEVAVRHADWCVALETMLGTLWPASRDESIIAPLPPSVAMSVLRILCRAPINLSNTALRLRSVQGDRWDIPSACGLLLLLVRQRRWKLALEHVAEMLPSFSKWKGDDGNDDITVRDDEMVKMTQTLFLLHGLRACANGGRSEEAAVLYDRLKVLLGELNPAYTVERVATNNARDMKRVENLLFSAYDGNCDDGSHELGARKWDERARIVAGQARLYFFRAMTKKSLLPQRQKD